MPPAGGVHKVFCSSKRYAIIKLDKIPLFKRFLRNFPVALLVSKIRDRFLIVRTEEALWHDIKKYTTAMQAVAAQNDSEQLRQIAQAAADAYERVKDISAVGNPVVDALLNQYLRSAKENQIQVLLDITIPEVLAISTLLLSVVIGNTFDNAIEACRLIAPEKRVIHLQLRKQNRILFYSIENPYIDAVTQLRVGKHHGYGLKNVERAVNQNNGNFQVEKVDGNFIVQIRLNCEN